MPPSAAACLLALGLTLVARADAAEPLATDARAWRAFPDAFGALAAAHLPRDASGLIGRNRAWGAMHSPRFQLGAGAALRTALAAGRPDAAVRAFRAIAAATDTIEADGSVPSRLPPDVGRRPSAADVASAAATTRATRASRCASARTCCSRGLGHERLAGALTRAACWLAGRIGPDGRIDSRGNARTCGGGENVFGQPKRVAVADVFTGLAYAGARTGDETFVDAASRLVARFGNGADVDPVRATGDGAVSVGTPRRQGSGAGSSGRPR